MNIYLLRHGETDWNREGRLQGRTDVELNQNGELQMRHVAEILDDMGLGVDLIISSPLSRAKKSAEIVAQQLAYERENILVEPLLTERCFGVGEGLKEDERKDKYPGDNYPEMEAFEDLLNRAKSAFYKIVRSYGDRNNILLVAHGAILYAMLTAITNGEIEYGGKMVKFDQGSIYRINYSGETIELVRYNELYNDFRFVYRGNINDN